jgi:hypothetical protein
MARKAKITLKSVQEQFAAYRNVATSYIYSLRNPRTEDFFSVKGYEKTPEGVLKPGKISVPELLAIVGTANRLGKDITITTSGVENGGQINVKFVDRPANVPDEIRNY